MTVASKPIPFFVDCDPGIDDAVALGYLLCQDDVDAVGIAASGGNVATAQVVDNALGWLTLADRTDIPVHPGAAAPLNQTPEYADDTHGPTGTGYAQLPTPTAAPSDVDAAHAWVAAARAHPGELTGVILGPATNLALALDIEPELPRLVKRIFIMGGAFNYRGNTRPTTEWNISWDPEAAARVIGAFGTAFAAGNAPYAPVIGPIEATEAVAMTAERFHTLLTGCPPGRWHDWLEKLGQAMRFYFEFHEWDGHGYLAHIHDPYVLAAAVQWARAVADPPGAVAEQASHPDVPISWAASARTSVDVELTGTLTRGETVADWLGRWGKPDNAELIRRIDAPDFLDHLVNTLKEGPHHATTR